MRFQMKEILKQIEVGLDPQEGLTQVDKDRDVEDGIRGQVMHLNPPVVKESTEEIRNGKTKAPKNMRKKNDRLVSPVMWKKLSIRTPPMDHALGLKKVTLYQIQKVGVGILTRLPPMDLRLVSDSVARLSPSSRSLGRHGNEEETFLSDFTLGG